MTMEPTPEQVAAQVAIIRRQRPEARVIGISTPGPWSGGATLRIDGDSLSVACCASALQVSEVLVSQASDGPPLVIVTHLDEDQLSLDVLARLAGRRLYRIDRWQMVRDLFRARQIDPRLASQGWIADALLQHIPEGGYPPVVSGLLDADTAWMHVLKPLGLPDGRPDAVALIRWSLCQQKLRRYAAWPRESRDALRQRVEDTTGALSVALLDTLDAGHGELLLPIGLVCEILFSADARQQLGIAQARARLEPYMAGRQAPEDRIVEAFLRLLDQHHDSISRRILAESLGQPEFRMRGIMVGLQRLLNVEGYQVIAIDEATRTIELNRQLLAKQFQLSSCLR